MADSKKKSPSWEVLLSSSTVKQKRKLSLTVASIFARLLGDLENLGPIQTGWSNFGALRKDKRIPSNSYHCHLKKGKPTYVACWQVINKKIKVMEIFYVGTHENAPYR